MLPRGSPVSFVRKKEPPSTWWVPGGWCPSPSAASIYRPPRMGRRPRTRTRSTCSSGSLRIPHRDRHWRRSPDRRCWNRTWSRSSDPAGPQDLPPRGDRGGSWPWLPLSHVVWARRKVSCHFLGLRARICSMATPRCEHPCRIWGHRLSRCSSVATTFSTDRMQSFSTSLRTAAGLSIE